METTLFDYSMLKNKTFRFGFILFCSSATIFLTSESWLAPTFFQEMPLVFFTNYGLFFIYLIAVFRDNKLTRKKYFRFSDLRTNIPLLLLFNLSAYSLNRSIPVFENSTEWLQGILISMNLAMLVFCFRPKTLKPDALNIGILIFLALGFVLQVYQIFYLLPFYGFTIMTFWFFGFSLHSLVAIWFSITLYKMIKQYLNVSESYRWVALGSVATPLFALALFGLQWNVINQIIQEDFPSQSYQLDNNQVPTTSKNTIGLPDWVHVSQRLDDNWITKRALKSEMVYTILDPDYNSMFFPSNGFGSRFNEPLQHDPLVALTSLVFGKIDLYNSNKYKLYQATFNARHQTEQRLWSGDHLITSDIETNIELFPEYRISYTEKIFIIKNNLLSSNTWQSRNTQEAIYSFYLPEGAVVTSASLWVNGIEEKSYLTTRSKADTAYKAIVGVERRDPLLLHWQEGNRISVRVFPCTPQEDRIFKIGVTAPMKFENKKLTYTNIDFEGPNWISAKEKIKVIKNNKIKNLKPSLNLKKSADGWNYEGKYKSDWTMTMDAPLLAYSSFSFNGRNLRVKDLLPMTEKFTPKNIYLDINSDWNKSKCKQIWGKVKDKNVYVFTDTLKLVTDENYKNLFSKLRQNRFSIFPFHQLDDVQNSLVITQGHQFTPALKDLKGSPFADDLNSFFSKNENPIRVFNFGNGLTTYLKTLKELQVFNFQNGNMEELFEQLSDQRFPKYQNDSSTVSITPANIQIETEEGERSLNNAPDHLLRLFAYNDLMKKIGRNYFNQQHITEQLIGQAQEAYVVTPISSMVVLETQKDYERFGIEEAKGSLKNASISNSGSVPEPHEWLLIILCVLTLLFFKFKNKIFITN